MWDCEHRSGARQEWQGSSQGMVEGMGHPIEPAPTAPVHVDMPPWIEGPSGKGVGFDESYGTLNLGVVGNDSVGGPRGEGPRYGACGQSLNLRLMGEWMVWGWRSGVISASYAMGGRWS